MSVLHVTKEIFENEIMTSNKPVLLDFWATWCGPCKMMAPVIEEVAEARPDVIVGKVDVDEEPALATKFGIMSIPTLVVMEKGEVKATEVGYRPAQQVLAMLDN